MPPWQGQPSWPPSGPYPPPGYGPPPEPPEKPRPKSAQAQAIIEMSEQVEELADLVRTILERLDHLEGAEQFAAEALRAAAGQDMELRKEVRALLLAVTLLNGRLDELVKPKDGALVKLAPKLLAPKLWLAIVPLGLAIVGIVGTILTLVGYLVGMQ